MFSPCGSNLADAAGHAASGCMGIRRSDRASRCRPLFVQAKSSYLAPFLNLRNLIQREAIAAEDNLKFLLCLEKPCQRLARATPLEIPPIMPHLLNCIRMVWNISRFYNTPERLTGLLRKVSNEIIARCCSVIDLDDIFGGDIFKVDPRACPGLLLAGPSRPAFCAGSAAWGRHRLNTAPGDEISARVHRCWGTMEEGVPRRRRRS